MAAILILGVAWFTVSALSKAASRTAEKEIRTGQALFAAKRALLGYIAQYAARTDHDMPGRLPCPEPLSPPAASEGVAASLTCNDNTATYVGRLPWRTLGIDQLRDGDGDPLWYVLGPGFRGSPINPGTPGQLMLDSTPNAAVALVIAPGAAINTLLDPGTPPAGCGKRNQGSTRFTLPYNPLDFLECGNATGAYVTSGSSFVSGTTTWINDHAIAITAAEVMDAISGPVADRLQRQVAPAMNDWRTTQSVSSWGVSFLPNASTFNNLATNPSANDRCGDLDEIEGMPPTASVASGACNTAWSSGSSLGIPGQLAFGGCTPGVTEMRCTFSVIVGGTLTPTITATAPHIAHSFRSFSSTQIMVEVNGSPSPSAVVALYVSSVSSSNGNGTITFEIVLPPFLSPSDFVVVRIPNPADAWLTDTRMTWFLNNNWDRFTYYAVSRAATVNPAASVCATAGDLGCLTVNGLPSPSNNKRLVLALTGRPLPTQTWPSGSLADYVEAGNATKGDFAFDANTVTATFNDRIAACPFQLTPQSGAPVSICN